MSGSHCFDHVGVPGQTILRIAGHDDDVNAVAFLDSGSNLIASGSDDSLIKVRRSPAAHLWHPDAGPFCSAYHDDRHAPCCADAPRPSLACAIPAPEQHPSGVRCLSPPDPSWARRSQQAPSKPYQTLWGLATARLRARRSQSPP